MFFKLFLMKLDHFFTERLNHWIGQLKYGKEIDFSMSNLKRGGVRANGTDYVGYQASVLTDSKMIKALSISREDRMLDIGCGKGKMVFYFDKLGFGRSDGIEYSKALADCAERNMKILKRNCSIIHGDAISFEGYKDYNYFYLYNPFGKETMRRVMQKIEDSYEANPRKITIIYYNPLCHEQVVQSGFFHLRRSDRNMYRKLAGRICNIYTNKGRRV